MKTLVLGIIFIGLTSFSFSQNQLASTMTSSDLTSHSSKKSLLNIDYLNTVNRVDVSKKIQKLQSVVASYKIKEQNIYQSKRNTTYTVDFSEGDNKIEAIYDKNGDLLSSEENYKTIKLPYDLSSKIAKAHPGWAFDKIQCNIKYSKDEQTHISYRVIMKQGRKTKTINIGA